MRLKCIGCEALARMVYYHAALSNHIVDIEIVRLGLHNTPDILRSRLQASIDATDDSKYDAILLAYGLCGKSTNGLVARNKKLVLPRAHDCITLFLGSREKYKDQFENQPGTYWYALDYLQRNDDPGTVLSLGASELGNDLKVTYQSYVEKYGQDNADYLMGIMGAWHDHYQRAVYIEMGIGNGSQVEGQAQTDANERGWKFERMQGDSRLIQKLVNGDWDEEFQILQPGERLAMTYDENIIGCEPQ